MSKRTKPFISRPGGKTSLLAHLLPKIPTAGVKCYVEAFGGGAAVLLARPRIAATVEVYNDTDEGLVNAFRQVREHAPEVIRCLSGRVNSRTDFYRTRDAVKDTKTEVQRAADWIWLNKLSFGSDGSSFGVVKKSGGGGVFNGIGGGSHHRCERAVEQGGRRKLALAKTREKLRLGGVVLLFRSSLSRKYSKVLSRLDAGKSRRVGSGVQSPEREMARDFWRSTRRAGGFQRL